MDSSTQICPKRSGLIVIVAVADIGGARNMKLVGPSQSHPQANGSLRMRCQLAKLVYYI